MFKWHLALPLALCSPLLMAQGYGYGVSQDDYSRMGNYASAAFAVGLPNFPQGSRLEHLTDSDVRLNKDNSYGFSLRLGQRLHPNFAAELAYDYQDNFDGFIRDTWGSRLDTTYENWSLMANFKFYMPQGAFQPYALGGLGIMDTKLKVEDMGSDKKTLFGARVGAGMDLYLNRDFYLNVEGSYFFPTGGRDYLNIGGFQSRGFNFATINFGAGYRF